MPIDTAVVGLIGALVGAGGALSAVLLTHYFTRTREEAKHSRDRELERERWLRDQRQSCYHNAVKYLIRIQAVGAQAKNLTSITLPQDAPPNWYDDIAEANAWLSSLHYFCGDEYHDDIGEVSTDFLNLSNWLIGFRPTGTVSGSEFLHVVAMDGKLDYQEFVDVMNQIQSVISNCARREFKPAPKRNDLSTAVASE
jgi:hypothetical protein